MSQRVYCIAQFQPKPGQTSALFKVLQALEPNTLREDGCLQYRVTRQIQSPFADGKSMPIAFNEIWRDMPSFEAHCQRREIVEFFETQCQAETGLVADWNVCVYSDEPEGYDAPVL
jgi:quinol monooxygenase YgiN